MDSPRKDAKIVIAAHWDPLLYNATPTDSVLAGQTWKECSATVVERTCST